MEKQVKFCKYPNDRCSNRGHLFNASSGVIWQAVIKAWFIHIDINNVDCEGCSCCFGACLDVTTTVIIINCNHFQYVGVDVLWNGFIQKYLSIWWPDCKYIWCRTFSCKKKFFYYLMCIHFSQTLFDKYYTKNIIQKIVQNNK